MGGTESTPLGQPRAVALALRHPRLARLLVRAVNGLPPGRIRRYAVGWQAREMTAGCFNRRDYDEALRVFGASAFEFWPAPELVAMLSVGHLAPGQPLLGVEPAIRFVDDWFEAWDAFTFTNCDVTDLGDSRFLLLHHLDATGKVSGLRISAKEEAQLWEFTAGRLVRVRQWWSWEEGRHCCAAE